MSEQDRVVAHWFEAALTEKEAHQLVGHLPGTLHYGTVVAWAILPEAAREVVRTAYKNLEVVQ